MDRVVHPRWLGEHPQTRHQLSFGTHPVRLQRCLSVGQGVFPGGESTATAGYWGEQRGRGKGAIHPDNQPLREENPSRLVSVIADIRK